MVCGGGEWGGVFTSGFLDGPLLYTISKKPIKGSYNIGRSWPGVYIFLVFVRAGNLD